MAESYDTTVLMLGYLENDLLPQDRARFERKMSADPALAQLNEDLQADRAGLRRLPCEEPPQGISEQVIQINERQLLLDWAPLGSTVDAPDSARKRYQVHRWLSYGGLAAMLVLGAGVLTFSLLIPNPPDQMQIAYLTPDARTKAEERTTTETSDQLGNFRNKKTKIAKLQSVPAGTELNEGTVGGANARSEQQRKHEWATGRNQKARTATSPILASQQEAQTPALGMASLHSGDIITGQALLPLVDIHVDTTDTVQTRQQLTRWAISNDVQIISEPRNLGLAPTQGQAWEMTLKVRQQQVSQLMATLNQAHGQRATASGPPSALANSSLPPATSVSVGSQIVLLPNDRPHQQMRSRAIPGHAPLTLAEELPVDVLLAPVTPDRSKTQLDFQWVSVLEHQLPLAPQTPIDSLFEQRALHLRLRIYQNLVPVPTTTTDESETVDPLPATTQ